MGAVLGILLLGEIAVGQRDVVPGCGEALLQSFGDDDGPMASPGASNSDVQVTPTLAFKQGNEKREEIFQTIQKTLGVRIFENQGWRRAGRVPYGRRGDNRTTYLYVMPPVH